MSFAEATHLSAAMLALAFVQQCLEHLRPSVAGRERLLFTLRLALSILLLIASLGAALPAHGLALATVALLTLHLAILPWFNGPYNGGADRMGLLMLVCLSGAFALPEQRWREVAFGYLGLQLLLSYVMAGWVKVVNPDWRNGRALRDVFLFSAYPAGENLRRLADRPRLLRVAGWSVMALELAFPLAMLSRAALIAALAATALFHLANACLFGLNRFFWIWIAAYPSILWLQDRLLGAS